MLKQDLKAIIEAADRAITAEDFDRLMDFYAEDATLVVKPGMLARGKPAIRRAFEAIAAHLNHDITVKQGEMTVIDGNDTALVIMETLLQSTDGNGVPTTETRRATYVFRRGESGKWLCVIDNSYGTSLLDVPPAA